MTTIEGANSFFRFGLEGVGHFGTEDYEYFLSIQLTRVAKGSKTKEVNLIVGEG